MLLYWAHFEFVIIVLANVQLSLGLDTQYEDRFEIQIIKTNYTSIERIASTSNTPKELICQSEAFVDNSLFIKFFYEQRKMAVTVPRAFGKSITLRMVREFFGYELKPGTWDMVPQNETAAYKLFINGLMDCEGHTVELKNKFLISKINNSHVLNLIATKPVIHLDLGNPAVHNYESIITFLRNRISECLYFHRYLGTIEPSTAFITDTKQCYRDLVELSNSNDIDDLASVLSRLVIILNQVFHKNVIVLIDEYDAVLNFVFFGAGTVYFNHDERTKTVMAMRKIFGLAKHSLNVDLVLITGIFPWKDNCMFSEFSRLNFHTVDKGDAVRFYGMSELIVTNLLEQHSLKHLEGTVKSKFNGYDFGNRSTSVIRYNPYAVARFISSPQHTLDDMHYWTESGNVRWLIGQLLKYHNFFWNFLELLSMRPISLKMNEASLSEKNVKDLLEVIGFASTLSGKKMPLLQDQPPHGEHDDDHFGFHVLFLTGYLTRHRDLSCNVTLFVKIPNQEILTALLKDYYVFLLDSDTLTSENVLDVHAHWAEVTTRCSSKLYNFLFQDCPNLEEFGSAFEEVLYNFIPIRSKTQAGETSAYANEALIEGLLTYVLNHNIHLSNIEKFETQRQFSLIDKTRPDVVVKTTNGMLTIFELKLVNDSVNLRYVLNAALEQARNYEWWFIYGKRDSLYQAQVIKSIGVVVTKVGNHVLLKSRCVKVVRDNVQKPIRREPYSCPNSEYINVKLNKFGVLQTESEVYT